MNSAVRVYLPTPDGALRLLSDGERVARQQALWALIARSHVGKKIHHRIENDPAKQAQGAVADGTNAEG